MALSGTIGDFGLPDILQLIGLQRKTAVLSLDNSKEQVIVKFLEGNVVSAETGKESTEDRLGVVLVRTGKITEDQLQEALSIQAKTLQRLGHILVRQKFISEDELVEALRVQSMQILFRLFRWKVGRYKVDMVDSLDYDEQHSTPISADSLLMEGARMVDEWPLIERRIKSEKLVFERTEAAAGLDLEVASLVDEDMDFEFLFEGDDVPDTKAEADGVKLSPDERIVMTLVDGERTVQAINDRSSLGEFDTYRILAELLTRDLIREIETEAVAAGPSRATGTVDKILAWTVLAALIAVCMAALFTLEANRFTPWRLAAKGTTTDQLRLHASQARLERIEQAIQVFYLTEATFPLALEALAESGFIGAADLRDAWGRPYGFERSAGGYRLFGHDSAGDPLPGLTRSHRFSAAQQMMFGTTAP